MSDPAVPVVADSITSVPRPVRGIPVICASHGGIYSAVCAARLGVSAAAFNDAGVGREGAGLGGLGWLDAHGIPGLAISHLSARIGDGQDCWERGVVSTVNSAALACGVHAGMKLPRAYTLLPHGASAFEDSEEHEEARHRIQGHGDAPVVAIDSNSLVMPEDIGAIVITGSHGGLLGGRPATAIKQPVFAAFYNDAGVGIDDAGISRLPALDARGIAGIAVRADSARIGDGMSTYRDGIASFVNNTARAFGARPGMHVIELVGFMAAAWRRTQPNTIEGRNP